MNNNMSNDLQELEELDMVYFDHNNTAMKVLDSGNTLSAHKTNKKKQYTIIYRTIDYDRVVSGIYREETLYNLKRTLECLIRADNMSYEYEQLRNDREMEDRND